MKPARIKADWLGGANTQAVFQALMAEGHVVRAVGGAVRNSLLGEPVADIDLATTALPEDTMRLAQAAGLRVIPTGLAHGTVTVLSNRRPFEVTTLRRDVATDGRRADVAFTDDWLSDAHRRDFTINALYADPDGTVIDPIGGLEDLAARRIRFIGDPIARIREDYLRILRFFRFFAQYGTGQPDADGVMACVRERGGLKQLSGERVHQELTKLLGAQEAGYSVTIMYNHGLFGALLPVAPRPATFHRLLALDAALGLPSLPMVRLAALAVHVREDATRLADRLKVSNADRHVLEDAASCCPGATFPASEAELRIHLYKLGPQRFQNMVRLYWARTARSVDDAALGRALSLPDKWTVPAFPVSGGDIIARGIPPGPRVGDLLAELEAGWISGNFSAGRAELLAVLDRLTD